jgi:CHAT domain-containing protein
LSQAEADYREALRVFHSLDMPEQEFSASLGLAQTLVSRLLPQDALRELTRTLQLAEELRLQSANPELRAKLLETSRPAFDLKIAILADRYVVERQEALRNQIALEALETSEQARARALIDFTRLEMAAKGASPKLLQERQFAYRELSARRESLESLLEGVGPDNPRVTVVRGDIATLRQRLNDIDARLAAASIRPTLVETSWTIDTKAIADDAAVIAYWLGRERAFAWAITRDRVALIDLGHSAAITSAALALHKSLRASGNVSANYRLQLAEQLEKIVFAPVRSSIAGKKALTIVADGALHYIPFALLRTRVNELPRFLIEDHDLANAPSIRTLMEKKQPTNSAGKGRMLLVADPMYQSSDTRLRTSVAEGSSMSPLARGSVDLRRLPGTAQEAAAIRAFFDRRDIDILVGGRATRDHFLAMDLRSYRFIHIASHAVADSEIPQLSAIILSTVDDQGRTINGRLLAADILNLRFDTELVVLSGCETALGKSVAGEGLVGLQYVMLARGARHVLSSLWEVPDQKTAELMSRFYSAMLSDRSTPRQSLASVMRSMLARGSDPAMWGAFVVTTTDLVD